VVTVLGRPGRGASQVEKSQRLNRTTQFLTVVYDGAYSHNVSIRMAWIFFCVLPCRGKKLYDSSRLDVVEIARVAWHASFQRLWQEKTCNSAREQTPLSNDTINSVLRRWEVGEAKDLSAHRRRNLELGGMFEGGISHLPGESTGHNTRVQVSVTYKTDKTWTHFVR